VRISRNTGSRSLAVIHHRIGRGRGLRNLHSNRMQQGNTKGEGKKPSLETNREREVKLKRQPDYLYKEAVKGQEKKRKPSQRWMACKRSI